jgi:DNA-binding PadR family transcriptional regulator
MTAAQLGDLQQLVMLAVARLAEDAFGSRIRRELEDVAGRRVSTGTVHVTLVRLERDGLVRSTRGEPVSGRGGRTKRLFQVTPAGWRALEAARQTSERMWHGVQVPTR